MDDAKKKPGKGKRILLWISGGILLVLVLVAGGAYLVATHFLDEDRLVAVIEKSNNCRLQIGSLEASVFGSPARISATGVLFLARDGVADAGTPHSQREAVGPQDGLQIDSLSVEASTLDLLFGKVTVKALSIDGLRLYTLVQREGGHTLEELFDPPVTVEGAPNPDFEKEKARRDEARELRRLSKEERAARDEQKKKEGVFNVAEIPMPATLKKFRMTNSYVYVKIRQTKNRISISDIDISLDDLDVDPDDLEHHNFARLSGSGHLEIRDRYGENLFADMRVALSGDIAPFDPLSGSLNPDVTYQVTALRGSKIMELPPLERLGKNIDKWRKYGIELEDIGRGIDFHEDSTLHMGYSNGRLSLAEDGPLHFSGHTLTLRGGSWLDFPSDEHEMKAGVVLSKEYSAKSRARTVAALTEKYGIGGDVVEAITDILLAPITKDGSLSIAFTSKGEFSRPTVLPDVGELKNAGDLIKGEAKDKAMELLQGLLDE